MIPDVGGSVTLHCRGEGWPLLETYWSFNGTKVTGKTDGEISVSTTQKGAKELNIKKLSKHFTGMYTFVAKNKYGSCTRTVQLNLNKKESKSLH